jgi:type IV fimbrial biogenesis protein FimT
MKITRESGFSLIEMMIALIVLAVLVAIAAPGLSDLIRNNRMLSQVYAMRAALNGARSEALAQRSFVTLCRSSDGASCIGEWNDGYIAFVDNNGDGIVDDPNSPAGDQVFIAKVLDSDTLDIAYSNAANRVRFDSQGYARNFEGTFSFCDDRSDADARGVIVTPVGVVRALDPNDPITCL